MKKQYITPSMRAHRLHLSQMVCNTVQSLKSTPINSSSTSNLTEENPTAEAKRINLWADDAEN